MASKIEKIIAKIGSFILMQISLAFMFAGPYIIFFHKKSHWTKNNTYKTLGVFLAIDVGIHLIYALFQIF